MADEPNKTSTPKNDNRRPGTNDPYRQHTQAGEMREESYTDPSSHFDDPEMETEIDDSLLDAGEVLAARLEEMESQQADLAGRLAKAQEEIHRYQAEIQNLHRRREKETEETSKYAIAKFAKDVVEVSDNFERAISSVPESATQDNPVLKSLLDGVTMTERVFLNVLEKHGVNRITPKDELFDPHQHQAVMEQEDKTVPAGTVLQVLQSGYIIAGRVLRPAMVIVARGGPKPLKTAAPDENGPSASAESDAPESREPQQSEGTNRESDNETGNA